MKEQNFSNHKRMVPLFHYVTFSLIFVMLVCSSISLYRHWSAGLGLMLPALVLLGSVVITLVTFFARSFALVAQNRAIRAEENLRYFSITGNLFDPKLRMGQIIALRFAPNNEFVELAHKAVENNLSQKEIKQAIKHWKGDYHRV